jgi:hypothetical protein
MEVGTMKFRYAIISAVTFIIFAANLAYAAESSSATVTVSVTIKGGSLSIEATDLEFDNIDLTSGSNSAIAENTITVNDPTGSGAGWNVTVKGSDLVAPEINQRLSLEELDFEILCIGQDRIRGNSSSENRPVGIDNNAKVSYNDQKLVTAAKKAGSGRFQIRPMYKLTIPENTKPGNYMSNLTYTIFQGP